MALYKKADFAKLCGLTTGNLTNYITRKQVIMVDGLIDDQESKNKLFLEKRKPRENTTETSNPPASSSEGHVSETKKKGKKVETSDNTWAELEKKKLELEILKKTEEVEKLKNQNAKQQGDVIPYALIPPLFEQQARSFATNFRNGLELMLTKVQKMADLDRDQMAKLKTEQLEIINISINNSFDDMQKVVDKIAADFSQNKGVGERN